jgi:hypothetical protein
MKKMRKNKGGLLLDSRWAAYAAAATATAFGTAVAEAEIHYSGTIREEIANSLATFPLSNGATIKLYDSSNFSYLTAGFYVGAAVSQGFRALTAN